jgi:hypothetical protein
LIARFGGTTESPMRTVALGLPTTWAMQASTI